MSRYEPVLIEEPYQSNPWAGMEEDRDGEYVKYKEYQLLEKEVAELKQVRAVADAVTQARGGEFYSLRPPRFKTFRGFEKGGAE